jgi:hypothetical protein
MTRLKGDIRIWGQMNVLPIDAIANEIEFATISNDIEKVLVDYIAETYLLGIVREG